MPRELAPVLFQVSLRALKTRRCSRCRRAPLVGELVHELASGRHVCALCIARVPARQGEPVRSERIRASERPLELVERAA